MRRHDESERTEMLLTFNGLETNENDRALSKPIEILAWSFGASYEAVDDKQTAHTSRLQNLSMTKYASLSSPALFSALHNHRFFKSVILECVNKNQIIKLVLQDAYVSSVSTGGSGGESMLTENFTLGFKSIETIYEDRMKEGGKPSTSNVLENKDPYYTYRRY